MDINFHYFAVKYIAIVSGLDEKEAQLLAEYSQFVDEYACSESYFLRNVPEYAEVLYREDGKCHTVQTGFVSKWDYTMLMNRENQMDYLIPFHFIPYQAESSQDKVKESYHTHHAKIGDNSIISGFLKEEAQNLRKSVVGTRERKFSLISMGLLLHVFADTYAHENFGGFHGDSNLGYLRYANTNIGRDVTPNMGASSMLPAIGHGMVGAAPDVTCVAIKANQPKKNPPDWSRENWKFFMECAKEILKLLTSAVYGTEPTAGELEEMEEVLTKGFAIYEIENIDYKNPDVKELEKHWSDIDDIVRPVEFHYDTGEIQRRMTPDEKNHVAPEEFYMYNTMAYAVRMFVRTFLP